MRWIRVLLAVYYGIWWSNYVNKRTKELKRRKASEQEWEADFRRRHGPPPESLPRWWEYSVHDQQAATLDEKEG